MRIVGKWLNQQIFQWFAYIFSIKTDTMITNPDPVAVYFKRSGKWYEGDGKWNRASGSVCSRILLCGVFIRISLSNGLSDRRMGADLKLDQKGDGSDL